MVIEKLEVIGEGFPTASIEFSGTGNVISGASNTGKTFVFECLRYMFGDRNPPKPISQSEGYEKVILHVDLGGLKERWERSIRGGDYRIHLGKESSEKTRKEFNDKLLKLIGTGKKRLKKNANNVTTALSFSYLRPYFFVDEVSIVEQGSPIVNGDINSPTAEKSLFRLLLTGRDDSDLIKAEDSKIVNARKKGRSQAVDAILEKFSNKLGKQKEKEIDDELKRCDQRVTFLSVKMKEVNARSSEMLKEKQDKFVELDRIDTEGREITETLKRFNLLSDTYAKDSERLDFVSEGKHLLSQLTAKPCPYCGKVMDHVHGSKGTDDVFGSDVSKALEFERQKVVKLHSDLKGSIKALDDDRKKLVSRRKELEDELELLTLLLKKDLSSSMSDLQLELKEVLEQRDIALELKLTLRHMSEVESLEDAPESEATSLEKKESEDIFGEDNSLFALESEIQDILKQWMGKTVKVSFDKEVYDIVIDGQPRRSFGKGYRSIFRTSFHLGLLNLCVKKKMPHPRFLVVDSPLTTHEEADDKFEDGIEERFFEFVSKFESGQLIIFDNKEPSKKIRKNLEFCRFSGTEGSADRGFIPTPQLNDSPPKTRKKK